MSDLRDLLASDDRLTGGHERSLEVAIGREVDRRLATGAVMFDQDADPDAVWGIDLIYDNTIGHGEHWIAIIAAVHA